MDGNIYVGGKAVITSYVGMIIHSTTLDTEAKVIAIYGGTSWSKLEGRVLVGEGTLDANHVYTAGSTGGEAEHTLTIAEMPAHTHPNTTLRNNTQTFIQGGSGNWLGCTGPSGSSGGGQPHNIMQPYKVVYIWERTA